ncbi:hypothetical protein TorRG33x02_258030 [Trema orientale]|uniref:Uncharacterized protein n=1 Tax=Trema orientale TaxID=63057 RepID=A0A2P5D9T6_TREOI|nr:hypothetical protein TorRG33x02_258030 [Trema orientale]
MNPVTKNLIGEPYLIESPRTQSQRALLEKALVKLAEEIAKSVISESSRKINVVLKKLKNLIKDDIAQSKEFLLGMAH